MANDLTKRPWIIDTPSAINLTDDRVRVSVLRWVATAATAGGLATITDKSGRVFWQGAATATTESAESVLDMDVDGLRVPTLASGTLYIYVA
jgi:hypothetical protein